MSNWFELSDVVKHYDGIPNDTANSRIYNHYFLGLESASLREIVLYEIPNFIKDIYGEECDGWIICKKHYWAHTNIQIKKSIGGIEHSYVFDGYYVNEIVPVKISTELSYSEYRYISELCDFGKFIIRNMDKLNPSYRKNYRHGYSGIMTETLHCSWRSK